MINFICFLIFILILTTLRNNTEYFNTDMNYKSITVTLTKPVYHKIYIATLYKDTLYYNYGKILGKIYPINTLVGKGSVNNVQRLINNEVNFAIAQEDVVIDAISGKGAFTDKNKSIRFITSIFEEKVTLIVNPIYNIHSWRDLKGKTVCFGGIGSGSLYNALELCKLIHIYESDLNIIYGNPFDDAIFKKISNNEIAAFYMTGEHPDSFLVKTFKNNLLKIIGSNGIPDELVQIRFPTWHKSYINVKDYKIPSTNTKIHTFAVKTLLICNKKEDYSVIYRLIDTIFSNIIYIRRNIGLRENLEVLEQYSLSSTFPEHNIIPVHIGVIDYYYYLGIFTNNTDKRCSMFAGTGKCDLELIN